MGKTGGIETHWVQYPNFDMINTCVISNVISSLTTSSFTRRGASHVFLKEGYTQISPFAFLLSLRVCKSIQSTFILCIGICSVREQQLKSIGMGMASREH